LRKEKPKIELNYDTFEWSTSKSAYSRDGEAVQEAIFALCERLEKTNEILLALLEKN